MSIRTRIAIVGAGPAGLLLGRILDTHGIDYVIVERKSLEYTLGRIRAGILEQGSVELLERLGLGERLRREGLEHRGIYLQFAGERHHIDFEKLIGRTVTVYGQQEVVKDLSRAHQAAGTAIYYEAEDVALDGIESERPRVTFRCRGEDVLIEADYVVGTDGFHGVCRPSIPDLEVYDREYPFAWLGVLASVRPSTDELIYALHADGFAMHSMRSMEVSRLYLQVPPDENIDDWPDDRIWEALHRRLGVPGWTLDEGEITDKSITPMRSFVASTMQHGRLFLAGDAAHIVPPTGAKGLNSAIADVAMLGEAIAAGYRGNPEPMSSYSRRALSRQWKTQYFSRWMTAMLHRDDRGDSSEYDYLAQLGQLRYVVESEFAQCSLAEQYTGLPYGL
ncbi:4-hydroxybenzoate 3-monooxygenase [Saxibacter everestensis]|uniref:4-hydroxybenzoate 3-monooxygenase n=1 Tax=Saxibacter everestensis TaxID=2909229 RepID=A0ABY8QU11_9MICO|nr:4-hydroxybenzoate 3-monooxygenase [Brevibacteriaceae bacterium ZFBP1038]